MISEKKEALYLVDNQAYLHLKEMPGRRDFAYETFDKATGTRGYTGLIAYADMLENPIRNLLSCARVMAIQEIGFDGRVVTEVALRTLNQISTLEQRNTVLSGVKQKASQASTGMRKIEKRMKDIAGIQSAIAVCQEQKPVHDKYLKIGWKKRRAAFAESHQGELKAYNKAYRYLKKQHVDRNVNLDALEAEHSKLQADHAALDANLNVLLFEGAFEFVFLYGISNI